jgi:hypothetical protein
MSATGKRNAGLAMVARTVSSSLGITAASLKKLQRLQSGNLKLRGSIDEDFQLPIKGGKGSFSKDQTTAWVTIKGYFEILSPADGNWTLTIKDDTALVKKFTGVGAGQKQQFEYKTGFTLKLRIEAEWSKKQDTTLKIHLHATY